MSQAVVKLLVNDSGYSAKIKQAASTFMGFISQVGGAKSQYGALTKAIQQSTIAQEALNAVMSKNPMGAVMTVATAAAAKLVESLNTVSEEQQRLQEAAEERAEKERHENETVANSVADVVTKYQLLRNEWQSLSNEHAKAQWLKENKSKFQQLGIAVRDVKTAEDVFVNNTGKVVNALIARAKAEAYGELYKEKLKDKIRNDMNPTVDNGRMYIKQNRFVRDINAERMAGVTADEINWKRETVYKNGAVSNNDTFGSYSASALKKINDWRNQMALSKQALEEQELEMLSMNMTTFQTQSDNILDQLGLIPTPTGGGGGKGGKKTPKKTAEEIIREQYEKSRLKSNVLADKIKKPTDELGEPSEAFKAFATSVSQSSEEALSPLQKLNAELAEMKANLETAPDAQSYQQGLSLIAAKEKEIAEFTGQNTDAAKDTGKAWKGAAQAASSFGSALQGLDDPAAKVAGTIAQAVANIALAFASADLKSGETGETYSWIAATVAGLATMISTISAIRSATAYAQGGIVSGNSYSGDNQWARVNAGEVVLTRAMTNNLASQLTDRNRGLQIVGVVKGENLVLAARSWGQRTGAKGERVLF